jgi:hypothetical protein
MAESSVHQPVRRPVGYWRRTLSVCGAAAAGVVALELFINWALAADEAAQGPSVDSMAGLASVFLIYIYGPVLWAVVACVALALARVRPLLTTWFGVYIAGVLGVVLSRDLLDASPVGTAPVLGPASILDLALTAMFSVVAATATDPRANARLRAIARVTMVAMAFVLMEAVYLWSHPCYHNFCPAD